MKKILLAGDSICKRYRHVVMDRLKGKADFSIIKDKEYSDNGGRSVYILNNWNKWVTLIKPDIMHWNAGLHDLKIWKDLERRGNYCCSVPQYQKNIREVIQRCKSENITLIWATITPLRKESQETKIYIRNNIDVDKYNKASLEVIEDENITVNDLHKVIIENNRKKCISTDGVHQNDFGNNVLGNKIAEFLKAYL